MCSFFYVGGSEQVRWELAWSRWWLLLSIDRTCLGHALHELNGFDVVYTVRIMYLKGKIHDVKPRAGNF